MRALAASAKTTRLIELKLETDSEKERKSTPKHERHILRLLTSQFMSISPRWRRDAHMGREPAKSVQHVLKLLVLNA